MEREPDAGEPTHEMRDAGPADAGEEKDERGPQGGAGGRKENKGLGGSGGEPKAQPDASTSTMADAGTHKKRGVADSGTADAGAEHQTDAGSTAADASLPAKKNLWSCRPVSSNGCICTESDKAEDSCPKPLPSCCFTRLTDAKRTCECWPATSQECRDYRDNTQTPNLTSTCPL